MQLIPGTHGARPAELVEAGADDAAGGLQLALDQQPHGERGGMPAARRQAAEDRATRRRLVQIEGVRLEFGGETLDPLLLDPQPPGAEGLSYGKVLEISRCHAEPCFTKMPSQDSRHGG